MHVIVIASYLTAAIAFFAVTLLLALGWRGRRSGMLLMLATGVSTLWSVLLAYTEWHHALPANWLMLAEVLRYGAWLAFVSSLLGAWSMSGVLRGMRHGAQALWVVLALYCLLPFAGWWSFSAGPPLVGVLLLSVLGVVFLEQILRNVEPKQRWAVKFLLIALGGLFAYDIFLYSYAVLYHGFDASVWAARGFVNALLAPLLLVAAARNRKWALDVGVSRRAAFYSTSLTVVALYLIATAIGGYYVRLYGGSWGRVAEIALICFALLGVLLIASSGQVRARVNVFVHKNFFSLRHDYREQWLQLTANLAASDSDAELPVRAVRALAQTMDSPAGALFMRDETGLFVSEAEWNMNASAHIKLPADAPVFELMRSRRWIYVLDDQPPFGDEHLRAPDELVGLEHAWLLVPLVLQERMTGFVVLAQARAQRPFDWEDIDLLRTAGSQVAGTLMQAANARRLAEARQFEGFNRLNAFLMHDLKNVAAQQSLLLQNAPRHKNNPAFVDDMLVTVDNAVSRITRLLEQLRGDTGKQPARERVSVMAVIDKAIAGCQAQMPVPDCRASGEELRVRADAQQLTSALEHLIRNAQDAATADGHVAVRLHNDAGCAVIAIEDDGEGMTDEFVRNRLFKPFFTTKASKGMGIGAYQAREYVRVLGGSLEVVSVVGSGTSFTIRLPLAEPIAAASVTDKMRAAS